MDNISTDILTEFGFKEKFENSHYYYEKNGYILVPDLGVWKICSIISGQILMTNLCIDKVGELLRNYKEVTGKDLQ